MPFFRHTQVFPKKTLSFLCLTTYPANVCDNPLPDSSREKGRHTGPLFRTRSVGAVFVYMRPAPTALNTRKPCRDAPQSAAQTRMHPDRRCRPASLQETCTDEQICRLQRATIHTPNTGPAAVIEHIGQSGAFPTDM